MKMIAMFSITVLALLAIITIPSQYAGSSDAPCCKSCVDAYERCWDNCGNNDTDCQNQCSTNYTDCLDACPDGCHDID